MTKMEAGEQLQEQQLLEWARHQGAEINVKFYHSTEGVRGLAAARDLPARACLLRAPSCMALPMVYSDSAFASPALLREILYDRQRRDVQQQAGQQEQGQDALAQGLLLSPSQAPAVQGCTSHMSPSCATWTPRASALFLASLPTNDQLVTAYNLPDEAIPLMACPELERVTRILKSRTSRVHATGTAAAATATVPAVPQHATLCACHGAPFPLTLAQAEVQAAAAAGAGCDGGCGDAGGAGARVGVMSASLEDLQWAASLLCSRTFQSSLEGVMVMVPLMDMINHTDDSPEAYIASSSESESESESESAESDSSESGSESGQRSDGSWRMPAASPPNPACVAQELSVASHSSPDRNQHSHLEHSHTAQISPDPSIHSCNGSTKPAPSQPCNLPLHPHHPGPQPDPAASLCPGSAPDTGTVSGYRRCNSIYTSRAVCEGQEVHFTYHKGLRPDEYVIYYGFLPPAQQPPLLLAVDHHEYQAVREDPGDGDLYDTTYQLIIDPLDGPWRGAPRAFNGQGKALSREVLRLQGLLQDHDLRCKELGTSGALERTFPGRPWLPGLMESLRARRRAALVHEIDRLQKCESMASAARDLVAAARKMSINR